MKSKNLLISLTLLLSVFSVKAQNFLEPSFTYSHSKPAYITLTNGDVVEGELKKVSRKKGLIQGVKIVVNGATKEFKPEQITHMYLPPSNFDKLNKGMNVMGNAQKWNNPKVDNEKLKDGYIYFEQVRVIVKKKEQIMQMQLLNPHFSTRIKVYHDPFAKETASAGVAGVKMVGGLAKSYYISKDGAVAYRLFKSKYANAEFENLIGDCKEVKSNFKSIAWRDLASHIATQEELCGK